MSENFTAESIHVESCRKLVGEINDNILEQGQLNRLLRKAREKERGYRKELAARLFTLLAEDEGALDIPWVSHWAINVGDENLRRVAFKHAKERGEL